MGLGDGEAGSGQRSDRANEGEGSGGVGKGGRSVGRSARNAGEERNQGVGFLHKSGSPPRAEDALELLRHGLGDLHGVRAGHAAGCCCCLGASRGGAACESEAAAGKGAAGRRVGSPRANEQNDSLRWCHLAAQLDLGSMMAMTLCEVSAGRGFEENVSRAS